MEKNHNRQSIIEYVPENLTANRDMERSLTALYKSTDCNNRA